MQLFRSIRPHPSIAALTFMLSAIAVAPAQDEAALDLIRPALKSPSASRQQAALVLIPSLGLKGEEAQEVGRLLDDYLKGTTDRDAENRAMALRAYGKIDAPPAQARVVFARYLTPATDVSVRRAAAAALRDRLELSAAKLKNVDGASSNFNGAVAIAGTAAPIVWIRTWMPNVDSGHAELLRVNFIPFRDDCARLLPVCNAALEDADGAVRESGADGVNLIARAAAEQLPNIADNDRAVEPPELAVRWVLLEPAFVALNGTAGALRTPMTDSRISTRIAGTHAAKSLVLVRTLSAAGRKAAADDIAKLVKNPPPADPLQSGAALLLPALAERLTDESPDVRLIAAEAFEFTGADGRSQLSAIIAATSNPDIFVRWVSTRALGRMFAEASPIDKTRIRDALQQRLDDPDLDVRNAALTAFGRGGEASLDAADAIATAVLAGDPDQRVLAMQTLQTIKAKPATTVPALTVALRADAVRVRKAALTQLGLTGMAARPALPEVRKLLKDPDEDVRREAALTLLKIDKGL